ncbi:MAG: hypothetical protein ACOX5G_04720 [Kiritimatiellia bacterium]
MKNVLGIATQLLFRKGRKAGRDWFQLRAASCYLKTVRNVRLAFLGLLALAMMLMLLGGGLVLLHVGLYLLLPAPANVIVLLVFGALYVLVALVALAVACSEKTWMRASGAETFSRKALQEARRSS